MSQSAWDQASKVKRTHKRRRVVLAVVGVLLAVLALLVVFAPAIASPFAKSIIAEKASAAIEGDVDVRSVHLSWTGPQRVTGLRILERDKRVVADVDIEAGVGLASLALGGRDLGTISVTGVANIRREESGKINAGEATRPVNAGSAPKPASSGGGSIPPKLRANLDLSGLTVNYVDPALEKSGVKSLSLRSISGTGTFEPGTPLTFKAQGTIALEGESNDQGSISVNATVKDLVDSGGVFSTDRATIDAQATVQNLSPGLVARFVDAPIDIEKAAGSRVSVTVTANGAMLHPDASLEILAANVSATGTVGFEDKVLVGRKPLVVELSKEALAAVDRDWLAQVTGGSLDVSVMPSLKASVTKLRLPLSGGLLESLAAESAVSIGAMDATVRVGEGQDAVSRRIATQPATFSMATESLASGIDCTGAVAFQVDGTDGGTLTLTASASDLLSKAGAATKAALPKVRGRLALEGVDTAVLQPFVAAAGVDMPSEVGPRLSMSVDLTPDDEATIVHGLVESKNVNGDMNLRFTGSRLLNTELPSQLRVGTIGPLVSRMLADAGVRVRAGASFDVSLQQLDVDLASVFDGGSVSPGDVNARAEVNLGPTSGTLARNGQSHSFEVEQVGTLVQFAGPARSAQVRLATGGMLDGRPAGAIAAEFRLDELVAADGSWRVGMPASIQGRAELTGLNASLFEPYVTLKGTSVGELIGPTVDLVVAAVPSGEHTTRVTLSLTSEQVTGDGGFLLSPDVVTLDAAGLTFTHASLAPALASLVDLGPDVSVRKAGGQTEFTVTHFNLPLDPQTRAPQLDRLLIGTRLTVREVHLDRPHLVATDQLELRQLVVKTQQKPGQPGTADVAALMFDRRQQARVDAHVEMPGLTDAMAGKLPFSIASLRPSGNLTAPELPAAVLIEALSMAPLSEVDIPALASDLAGETFSVQVDLNTVNDKLDTKLAAKGRRFQIDASATVGAALESGSLTSQFNLSRASGDQLVRAFVPQMAETVGIAGATSLRVAGSLSKDRLIQANLKVLEMSISGLESQPLSFTLDSTVKTSLPDVAGKDRPLAVTFESAMKDSAGADVARATGDLNMVLGAGASGPINGAVRATGLRSAWADKILGSGDLYQGLIGSNIAISADATYDQATQSTRLSADVQAPRLKSSSKLSGTMRSGAIVLDQPYSTTWTGDSAWLSRRLGASLKDKAPTIDAPLSLTLDLRQLSLPPSTERVPGVVFLLDLEARVPQIDVTMPGGEKRSYRSMLVTAKSNNDNSGIDARIGADVTIAGEAASRALDVTAFVRALAVRDVLTIDRAYVNADAVLKHVPTSLVDAFAGTNGLLTDMLGPEVAIDDLKIRRAPAEGGKVSLTATSTNAKAVLAGTFKDANEDGKLVDGYFVVDEGGYVELSAFQKSFAKSVFDVVPILGEIDRDPKSERPSRLTIQSMSLPLTGGIEAVDFKLLADLGTVTYKLNGFLESGLKLAGGKSIGQLGGRIQPFDVSMASGIVRYDRLKVPIGEFDFDSNGTINLIERKKDLLVLMPAGQFGTEAFGVAGITKDMINDAVKIPMKNSGPLDNHGWNPDPKPVFKELFKPDKILDEAVKRGIGNLLNRGGGGSGGGGSGGGG